MEQAGGEEDICFDASMTARAKAQVRSSMERLSTISQLYDVVETDDVETFETLLHETPEPWRLRNQEGWSLIHKMAY